MSFISFKNIVYFHNRVFRKVVKITRYYILAVVSLIFADRHVFFFVFFLNEESNLELGDTLRAAEVEDVPLW